MALKHIILGCALAALAACLGWGGAVVSWQLLRWGGRDLERRAELAILVFSAVTLLFAYLLGRFASRNGPTTGVSVGTAAVFVVFLSVSYFSHVPPINRAAQRRTMRDMRLIAAGIEGYAFKSGQYPTAGSRRALEGVLAFSLPERDGWGTEFVVQSAVSGYLILSPGMDGAVDEPQPSGPTTSLSSDIIFKNGQFVAYPEGSQR